MKKKIIKRLIAFLLIISILGCSVGTQYRKAEANPGILFLEGIGAAAGAVASPYVAITLLVICIVGPMFMPTFDDMTGEIDYSSPVTIDDLKKVEAFGAQIWKDFKSYYTKYKTKAMIDSTYEGTTPDGGGGAWDGGTFEQTNDAIYEDIKNDLKSFENEIIKGAVSTKTEVFKVFKEFAKNYDKYHPNSAEFNPSAANSTIADFDELGLMASPGFSTSINDYILNVRKEYYEITKVNSEKDVHVAYVFEKHSRGSGNSYDLVAKTIFYSLSDFYVECKRHYNGGSISNSYIRPDINLSVLDWNIGQSGVTWIANNVTDEQERMMCDISTNLTPDSVFDSIPAFRLWLYNQTKLMVDLPDKEYPDVLPAPTDWTWERDVDIDSPYDLEHDDVIILHPEGITDWDITQHKEYAATLEALIELALAHKIPWSAVWDYVNTMDDSFPANPDENFPEDSEDNDKPSNSDDDSSYTLSGLEKIFPFCIPFDIYNFLALLDAKAEAPSFKWKLMVFEDEYNINIDLKEWDDVAKVLRRMEVILFVIGLAMVTRSRMIRS